MKNIKINLDFNKTIMKNIKITLIILFVIGLVLYFSLAKAPKTDKVETKVSIKVEKKSPNLKIDEQKIKQQLQQKWLEISKTTMAEKKEFWQKLNSYELEKFIKAGVYVKVRDKNKLTPLHFAAAYSPDTEVISLLVRTGAKINAKGLYDATPLHYAAAFNTDEDIIKRLIKLGADINAKDKQQRTSLHWIVKFAQNVEVIDALLNAKITINLKDSYGQTALDIIKNNKELSKTDREKVTRWLLNIQ